MGSEVVLHDGVNTLPVELRGQNVRICLMGWDGVGRGREGVGGRWEGLGQAHRCRCRDGKGEAVHRRWRLCLRACARERTAVVSRLESLVIKSRVTGSFLGARVGGGSSTHGPEEQYAIFCASLGLARRVGS